MNRHGFIVIAVACLALSVAAVEAFEPSSRLELTARPVYPVGVTELEEAAEKGSRENEWPNPPSWSFSRTPVSLMQSYYDYMPGGYNNLPLQLIPSSAGGGYFLTFQGLPQPGSVRRVFYGYLDPAGNIWGNAMINPQGSEQSWPAVVVDPVSGKPFYAWTAHYDWDGVMEVMLTSDAFIAGIPSLFNPPVAVIDNPITITALGGQVTDDNVFLNPSLAIGPSPVAGKRRLYVLGRQAENVYLACADFDGNDIELGNTLAWTYGSVPELDALAVDGIPDRIDLALTADASGNIVLMGSRQQSGPEPASIEVFSCGNYGQGEWTRYSLSSSLPSWNPPAAPDGTAGWFTDEYGVPYEDGELSWTLMNSNHMNCAWDGDGRLHMAGLWGLTTDDGAWYPELQFIKEAIYTPMFNNRLEIVDVFPRSYYDDQYCYQPWDEDYPYGEVDAWGGNADEGWYPLMYRDWPFPYWDDSAHDGAMMYHYNNVKLSNTNGHGQMAYVWQDSWKARQYNHYQDQQYQAYANSPETYILIEPDNFALYDPIVLSGVEVPQLAGITPVWVYPADKMIFTGYHNGHVTGKLGLAFYDDFTWGAESPQNDGGQMMFAELQIWPQVGNDDPNQPPVANLLRQNHPNPFNPDTTIAFELPARASARLAVYDVKGRLVKVLAEGEFGPGAHESVWDGTNRGGNPVSSGVYLYCLESGGRREIRRMALLK